MKLIIALLLISFVAVGQTEVKYRVTDNDPVTGKKMLVYLTGAPLKIDGAPAHITYLIKFKETNESDDAIPAGDTERDALAVKSYEERFEINSRKISSTTLLYLPDDTTDPNAIALDVFFATKAINQFPGVGGSDQAWRFAEGILRQMVLIKRANGEMPN